jgi:hypothetical protein
MVPTIAQNHHFLYIAGPAVLRSSWDPLAAPVSTIEVELNAGTVSAGGRDGG